MAESEHILKIKAVLDDADVRRRVQNVNGKNGSAGNGNLQTQLRSLNSSLNKISSQLNSLIKQMSGYKGILNSRTVPPVSRMGFGDIAALSLAGRLFRGGGQISRAAKALSSGPAKSDLSEYIAAVVDRNVHVKTMDRKIYANRLSKLNFGLPLTSNGGFTFAQMMRMKNFKYGGFESIRYETDPYFQFRMASPAAARFAGIPYSVREINGVNRSFSRINASQMTPAAIGRPNGGFNHEQFNRMVKFVGIDMFAQMGEQVAQESGNKVLAAISNIISSGASGAMAGSFLGPKGVIIGGAAGLGKGIYDTVTGNSEDVQKIIDSQKQRMFSAQSTGNTLHDWLVAREDEKRLKSNDRGYFETQLKEAQSVYDKAENQMKEIGLGRFDLREYSRKTAGMLEASGGEVTNEIRRRQNNETLYNANAEVLMKFGDRVQNLNKVLESMPVNSQQEWHEKRGKGLMQDRKELVKALQTVKSPDMSNVTSLGQYGLMTSATDDKVRLDTTNDYLNKIWQITKQISDKDVQLATYA